MCRKLQLSPTSHTLAETSCRAAHDRPPATRASLQRPLDRLDLPVAAYHVSGEYAMVHAAAQNGWLELEEVAFEHVGAIRRAGADMILTYFARLIAEGLQ